MDTYIRHSDPNWFFILCTTQAKAKLYLWRQMVRYIIENVALQQIETWVFRICQIAVFWISDTHDWQNSSIMLLKLDIWLIFGVR